MKKIISLVFFFLSFTLASLKRSPVLLCLCQMIFCQICCEPFHSFCLSPEERPMEESKENWCCRRCKFCHVCGRRSKSTKVNASPRALFLVMGIKMLSQRLKQDILKQVFDYSLLYTLLGTLPHSRCCSAEDAKPPTIQVVWDQHTQNP